MKFIGVFLSLFFVSSVLYTSDDTYKNDFYPDVATLDLTTVTSLIQCTHRASTFEQIESVRKKYEDAPRTNYLISSILDNCDTRSRVLTSKNLEVFITSLRTPDVTDVSLYNHFLQNVVGKTYSDFCDVVQELKQKVEESNDPYTILRYNNFIAYLYQHLEPATHYRLMQENVEQFKNEYNKHMHYFRIAVPDIVVHTKSPWTSGKKLALAIGTLGLAVLISKIIQTYSKSDKYAGKCLNDQSTTKQQWNEELSIT